MAYISILLLFVLSLVSAWFMTFKEDAKGKPIHNRLGFRIPTKAGVILLVLSSASFLFSIYSTWNESKDKERQRKEAEAYQQELKNKLDAARRETQRGIARVLNPIPKDLSISFGFLLDGDQHRVRDYIIRLMSQPVLGKSFRDSINTHEEGLRIGLSTNLYPDPVISQSEKELSEFFSNWLILVTIYSGNVDISKFHPSNFPGLGYIPNTPSDLFFLVSSKDSYDRLSIGLFSVDKTTMSIDIEANWSGLKASSLETNSDKVTSLLDLEGCTFIVEITPTQPSVQIPSAFFEGMDLKDEKGRTISISGFNPINGTSNGRSVVYYVSTPEDRKKA